MGTLGGPGPVPTAPVGWGPWSHVPGSGPAAPATYPQPTAGGVPRTPVSGPPPPQYAPEFAYDLLEIADMVVEGRRSPQNVNARFNWAFDELRSNQDRSDPKDKIASLHDDELAALVASVIVTQELIAQARRGFFDGMGTEDAVDAAAPGIYATMSSIGHVDLLGDITPGHYSPRVKQAAKRAVTAALPTGLGRLAAKWKKYRERISKKPKAKLGSTLAILLAMLVATFMVGAAATSYFYSRGLVIFFCVLLVIATLWVAKNRRSSPRRSASVPLGLFVLVLIVALIAGVAAAGGTREPGAISAAEAQRIKQLSPANSQDFNGVTRLYANTIDGVVDTEVKYCTPEVRKTDALCDIEVPNNNGVPVVTTDPRNLYKLRCDIDRLATARDHKTNGTPSWCPPK